MVRAYPGSAPTLDGNLDDPCWAKATTAGPFVLRPQCYLAVEQTRLLVSFDRERLFVAFECECPDSEKLFVGDGDPAANDRVELTLVWPGAPKATVLVDAAGRLKCSEGLDVKAAVRRLPQAYAVELTVPRPARAAGVSLMARRINEVTGEESAWGTELAMARAELAPAPGPFFKIRRVPRLFHAKETVELDAVNPTDEYVAVRCRVTPSDEAGSLPHLIRLDARQTVPVELSFRARDVRTGLELVIDEPRGEPVYLRSPSVRPPPGRPFRARQIDVIPHPRRVTLLKSAEPFVLDASCRIVVGARFNALERRAAELLQREIRDLCGRDVPVETGEYFLSRPSIVVATRSTTLLAARIEEKFDLHLPSPPEQFPALRPAPAPVTPMGEPSAEPTPQPSAESPEEGGEAGTKALERSAEQAYVLGISQGLIGVAGLDETGTLYGVQTLIQILASAQRDQGDLMVPAMRVKDWPALPLRGWLWRGPCPDVPSLYAALMRFKLNLLSDAPGVDAAYARASGVYLGRLQLPASPLVAPRPQPALLFLNPSDAMPRPLRHSLRLPITLEEGVVRPPEAQPQAAAVGAVGEPPPPQAPPPEPSVFGWHAARGHRPERVIVEEPREATPVTVAWVRGDPWTLCDAARQAQARKDVVGLCGGLRGGSELLPPSWSELAAAAVYGWSPEGPAPETFGPAFAKSFFGSAEVGQARDLLERAVGSLPRRAALADLLSPSRPSPSAPRPDLPKLVELAKAKAKTARRNRQLANLLVQASDRVLVAATNVTAVLRARELYAQAAQLEREKRPADAAGQISELAKCFTEGRARCAAILGEGTYGGTPDAQLYAYAALAARQIARQVAAGGSLPEPSRFWRLLKGEGGQ